MRYLKALFKVGPTVEFYDRGLFEVLVEQYEVLVQNLYYTPPHAHNAP